jgi:hypothetical protein
VIHLTNQGDKLHTNKNQYVNINIDGANLIVNIGYFKIKEVNNNQNFSKWLRNITKKAYFYTLNYRKILCSISLDVN